MRIRENVLKSVFFIGYTDKASGDIIPVGSAVYLCTSDAKQAYIVSAGHVLDNLRSKGVEEVTILLNLKEANEHGYTRAKYQTNLNDWFVSVNPDIGDIAFIPCIFDKNKVDYLAVNFDDCMNEKHFEENEVSLGDEIFVTGLFHHHSGKTKNIPIVRIGNLAALNEEKVLTQIGLIDAYLVEARSIGGLSGSAVYVNLGHTRFIKGTLKNSPHEDGVYCILLGIMHGHYDERIESPEDQAAYEKINMGIGIVTPIQKVIEFIENCSNQEKA